MRRLFRLAGLGLLCAAAQATVIAVCDEAHLHQAVRIGGPITFACGGAATIHITHWHPIDFDTQIDGGGMITFDGGNLPGGMFQGEVVDVTFFLTRLKVINAGAAPPLVIGGKAGQLIGSVAKVQGGFIAGRFRTVILQTVSVEHSWWPVMMDEGSLLVRGSTFSNNDGSVLVGGTMDVLEHSRFINNRGAPIASGGGTVAIDRSEFLSNSRPVTVANGTLRIYGANFTNNITKRDSGGALDVGSDATIDESEFRNNVAPHGGAIFIGGKTGKVSMHGTKFYSNVATQAGGAIAFEKSQLSLTVTMEHVTFEENRAADGGAISLERNFRNHLSLMGGAVAFINNRATGMGGAIYAPNANVQLSRGIFIGNQAGSAGGAVAALEQNDATTAFANSLIVRNKAPRGSAFWGNSATFLNTTITDNSGTAVWPQGRPTGPTLGTVPTFIRFVNSIVSDLFASPCGPSSSAIPYINGGNNLQFPGSGCGADIPSVYPFLGSYYVPFFWSAALHGGNQAVCDATPISHKDVYSSVRPQGPAPCAIGAVEGDITRLISRWRGREGRAVFGR